MGAIATFPEVPIVGLDPRSEFSMGILDNVRAECDRLASRVRQQELMLKEKSALLQEVNHRAKNSLQMAMAMLSMQALASDNEEVAEALRTASTKLGFFARVHELLYERGEDTQTVDVGEFLSDICRTLERAYQKDSVRLNLSTEPIMLTGAQAMNVGLIVGECISNAYKYAFPGSRSGVVSIVCCSANDVVELAIADNGVGFAAEQRRGSLGMRLLRALGRALGSETHIESGAGTRVTVAFPIDDTMGKRI